ncbi:MAG: LysE family translocator [Pseudomonadota bacterium]
MWIEFLLTSFIVVLAPGTGVIYTIGISLARGARASLAAAAGCTMGILPHIAAALAGVAALLHTSAVAFELFKYAGVAYLLYLAWTTLQDKGVLEVQANPDQSSLLRVARTGFLINILNPKLSIFFLAFLPQFVPDSDGLQTGLMLVLSAIFMAMTFAVFVLYGVFASAVRRHVVTKPRVVVWMRRVFAGAFVLLSARLLVEQA